MQIKQIAALLGGTVLMALAGAAGAGTLYNGSTTAQATATGGYNVAVYEDSIFNFHVNSITSNNGTTTNVNKVTVIFFSGLNDTGKIVTGFTTKDGGTDPAGTNWGVGHTAGKLHFFSGNPATAIQGAGTNSFSEQNLGYFVLNSNQAKSFEVLLQTGNTAKYYTESFNITDFSVPEASSLALLLPGLVPLGIALRRRRAARL